MQALSALKKDPKLAPHIKRHGKPKIVREAGYFEALVRSIIYQQVTGKAAATIFARFRALFKPGPFPTPTQVRAKTIEELRSAGLSGQKASYVHDLALKFSDGTIDEEKLDGMPSQEVLQHLVQVKGVGVWTVHMFLIFTLGKLDVLPVGDLGVRKGFQIVYNMRSLPTESQMEKRAKPWRQYASIASWYMWRVADEAKIAPKKKHVPKKKT